MRYRKPNFNEEWKEALRYREFQKMGKKMWIQFATTSYFITSYSKIEDVLNNIDLDYENLDRDKRERFEEDFESGIIEIPLVVKFSNNDYDLLGGNTRTAGLIKNGIDPKFWVIDMSKRHDYYLHETDLEEKWSEKYKKSIDCNNPKGFSQRAHCQGRKKKMNENEKLIGGNADNKELIHLAKKHDAKGYYQIDDMVKSLKKQLEMGMKVEMEHTDDKNKAKEIAMDHLWEDPKYYSKLKKIEADESTGASSSGAYVGPLFSKPILKRDIHKIHNANLNEIVDAVGFGYDVPFGGDTPKGKKEPLKISGPEGIYKGRAVKDKKFPRYGGPKAIFVKIKEKCKKFPYCNQGDAGALEFIKEDIDIQNAINEVSQTTGVPKNQIIKIVFNEIKEIFINNEN